MAETSTSEKKSPTLRVGLIGSGKMGQQHLKVIRDIPSAMVVGIADPAADRQTLEPLLPPGAEILADADQLLALKPDVVHIVTPPGTHATLAKKAIEAGCHVYVEKPFTPTAVEAESILAAAAARHLQVCAGHQYLFERPFLRSLEQRESIGDIVHVESYFSFKTARRTITPVDQAKDILPHAVYPLVEQLRRASGSDDVIEIKGSDVHASGDVYALLRLGRVTGVLTVTLRGRPVEQFQHLVGTNGWMRPDYITGSVVRLTGPGAGLGVLFTPYRRALQTLTGATSGFYRLIFKRKSSYPGLDTLIRRFYDSIQGKGAVALTPQSILDTVSICERLGAELDEAEAQVETTARVRLQTTAERRAPAGRVGGRLLVTGATGLLGRSVAAELAAAGYEVRSVSRRLPRYSDRVPGVDYRRADLGVPLPPELFAGIGAVVHCAAETAGGQFDQKKNSILATEHVLQASALAGVKRVLHISSLAVLKPGSNIRLPLDEATPVDHGNLGRGPYVWGKAESEVSAIRTAPDLGIELKVIRPGPLVDFADFNPPGRLGREVGPLFVAIGPPGAALSVCDVGTAARVIRHYVEDFENAPPVLNLVEAPPPTRRDLVARLRAVRPDLRVLWFPAWLLRILSGPLRLAQRLALGSTQPIDVYSAFASHRYSTDLAAAMIQRAGRARTADANAFDDVHASV